MIKTDLIDRNLLPLDLQQAHDRYKNQPGKYAFYVAQPYLQRQKERDLKSSLEYKDLDKIDPETDINSPADLDTIKRRIKNSGNPGRWADLKKECLEALEIKLYG